jgi:hypothetical protein
LFCREHIILTVTYPSVGGTRALGVSTERAQTASGHLKKGTKKSVRKVKAKCITEAQNVVEQVFRRSARKESEDHRGQFEVAHHVGAVQQSMRKECPRMRGKSPGPRTELTRRRNFDFVRVHEPVV